MEQLAPGARQQGAEYNGGEETSRRRRAVKNTNRAQVLSYVRSVKYVTIQDVATALNMSYSGAAAHLLALHKDGLLKKVKGSSFGHINGGSKSLYVAVKG